jgi:hypothetical protein
VSFYDYGPDYDTASVWAWRWRLWSAERAERRLRRRCELGEVEAVTPYVMAKYHRRRLEAQRPC